MKKFDYTLVFGLDGDMKEYFKTMLSDLELNYTVYILKQIILKMCHIIIMNYLH